VTARRGLRAVSPDSEPITRPVSKPKSVAAAAATGDPRELLIAMRDRIASTVSNPDCPPRDLASLTRRLQDIAKELDTLELRKQQELREVGSGCGADETWDEASI
jgi:hypothetical protein